MSAPIPLGAPILWPEIVSRSCSGVGQARPAACRTPARHRCGRATPAVAHRSAISATGCTTPTSLLTHITETTAGRSGQRRVERVEVQRPSPSTGEDAPRARRGGRRRAPRPESPCARWRRRPRTWRAPVPRGQGGAQDAEVVRLGAAGGEDTWLGSAPDRLGDLAPGLLQPARAARPNRWRSTGCRRPARSGTAAWPPAPRGEPGWWRRDRGRRGVGGHAGKIKGRATWLCTPRRYIRRRTTCHGLVREERLPVAGPDQRAVVGVLGLDQRVQVLAGGKDLARRLGAVELAGIAADGGQLPLELRR